MSAHYDQDATETIQRDIINITVFEVDECLRKLAGRDLVSTSEVTDMLLDVRQCLDRYYIHREEVSS